MSECQSIKSMEDKIEKIKKEHERCKINTIKNLNRLYDVLDFDEKNSEEKQKATERKPVAQV